MVNAETRKRGNAETAIGRRHVVHHGDCMAVLRRMPDDSVDAVITDPPYGVAWTGRHSRKQPLRPIANDQRPYIWWLHDAHRVVRAGGGLLCFCSTSTQERFRTAIEMAGFKVRSHVVWDKGGYGLGDTSGSFAPRHEIVWWATKGRFHFPGRRPASVLAVPSVPPPRRLHPTEKPLPLMRELVRSVTAPGNVVLDPCCGSGSTGVAALAEGRRFIGIECDGQYVATARRRLRDAAAEDGKSARPSRTGSRSGRSRNPEDGPGSPKTERQVLA